MSERSLILYPHEIRAALAGRLTQIRRPVRLPAGVSHADVRLSRMQPGYPDGVRPVWDDGDDPNAFSTRNPFGPAGSRLWVKETFLQSVVRQLDESGEYDYRWTQHRAEYLADGAQPRDLYPTQYGSPYMAKRPSIHMPRWASRLALEATAERVERLQAITRPGAVAGGVSNDGSALYTFAVFWDEVFGKKPGLAHKDNPYVWVADVKVVEQEVARA